MLMLLAMKVIHRYQKCKRCFSDFAKNCLNIVQLVYLLHDTSDAVMSSFCQKVMEQFLATITHDVTIFAVTM